MNKETKNTEIEIVVGSTVEYNGGFYRVSRLNKNTANLRTVFGTSIIHKSINRADLVEASEAHNDYWTSTDAYRQM